MGSFIARQPNGLLCRFSTVVDCVTHYNMTEEDYIELRAEQAREAARYDLKSGFFIQPFEKVKDMTILSGSGSGGHMEPEEWDRIRKEMGDE